MNKIKNKIASFAPMISPLLMLGIVGAIGFLAYKLYDKFLGTTPAQDAAQKAATVGVSDLTTRAAVAATSLTQLQTQLSAKGLNVGVQHQSAANQLNAAMDCASVDHDAVLGLVNSMGTESFQLTAIAYGQRELRNYRNSLLHILEPAVWGDMFSETKLYGSLKFHLQTVLTASEFSSIGAYTNSIP